MNVLCIWEHGDEGDVENGPKPTRDLIFACQGVDELLDYADKLMATYKPMRYTSYAIDEICKFKLPFGTTMTQEKWTASEYNEYLADIEEWNQALKFQDNQVLAV